MDVVSCSLPNHTGVLVVDDEPTIADTLALILKQNIWDARAFYSGPQAVHVADELTPYAVITNVITDGMNGFEVSILIARFSPARKLILFSRNPATFELLDGSQRRF